MDNNKVTRKNLTASSARMADSHSHFALVPHSATFSSGPTPSDGHSDGSRSGRKEFGEGTRKHDFAHALTGKTRAFNEGLGHDQHALPLLMSLEHGDRFSQAAHIFKMSVQAMARG